MDGKAGRGRRPGQPGQRRTFAPDASPVCADPAAAEGARTVGGAALSGGVPTPEPSPEAVPDPVEWTPGRTSRLCAAVLAMVVCSLRIWVQCGSAFPAMRETCPVAVDVQTLTSMLAMAAFALLAWRWPHRVRPLGFGVACVVCVVAGTALWLWGVGASSSPAMVAGMVVAGTLGGCWPILMVGITLCALGNRRDLITAAVCGEAVGAVLRCALPALDLRASIVLVCVLSLALVAVTHVYGIPYLARSLNVARPVRSMSVTDPEVFLGPGSTLVVLVALFELLHGVVLAEHGASFGLAATALSAALICVGGAWLLSHRGASTEDVLLYMGTLMLLLGFLIRPLSSAESAATDVLCIAGASFAWMLLWVSMASVGMANPVGALWTFGICYVMEALAMGAGSWVVALESGEIASSAHVLNLVNAGAATALVGYVLVALRRFSFSQAFRAVRPVIEMDEVPRHGAAQLDRACAELAGEYGLTERERDVLGMLARGMGGPQIQESLVVTQNTVKTHVRHVYRKLDVHSQREVVELVCRRAQR